MRDERIFRWCHSEEPCSGDEESLALIAGHLTAVEILRSLHSLRMALTGIVDHGLRVMLFDQ